MTNDKHSMIFRKAVLAGVLAAAGVALSVVSIPMGPTKCFPFQHTINVVAGIVLGPWWAVGAAFTTSVIRNLLGTGSLFAFQQYGVLPDLVTAAKGLGGGLPIGAVLFGEKCENTLQPGQHATTFGANPIVCAGANVVLDRLDDAFLQEVAHKGTVLKQALQALPRVVSVDGLGLMLGVQFEEGIAGRDVLLKCMQQGVLFLTAKQKLRLLRRLCFTEEQIQQGVAILCDILKNWED